jgi:rhamnosyltransferase
VTYHPGTPALTNIAKVREQVRKLVVVDNGSSADELNPLRMASNNGGYELIENSENRGIAEALNQGVRRATSQGYPWVILFDQDSTITGGFVEHMFAAWESHPDRERVASIHPRYVDPNSGLEPRVRRMKDGAPVVSMTSGSLLPAWIFDRIGWFASEYFIDCVDLEYCLRIRAAGYLIADSKQAVLLHAAGHASRNVGFLRFDFRPTNHDAVRRYYIARNRLVLYRKYCPIFPRWMAKSMYDYSRETIKCFVGEQDRARKFRNFLLGTWDGLIGKMGRREGLCKIILATSAIKKLIPGKSSTSKLPPHRG